MNILKSRYWNANDNLKVVILKGSIKYEILDFCEKIVSMDILDTMKVSKLAKNEIHDF